MGKNIHNRRKIKNNLHFSTSYYRRKLLLLKHLKRSRLNISGTLAHELLDEDTRTQNEIMNDLEPSIIRHRLDPIKQLKKFEESFNAQPEFQNTTIPKIPSKPTRIPTKHTKSKLYNLDELENNSFLNYSEANSGDLENNNVIPDEKIYTNSNHIHDPTNDFILPPVSKLEETGLNEFYHSFLNAAEWQISNLNSKPGDEYFLFWFFSSSYIPLLCSCSGPLSNVFSLLAIICPWKIHKTNRQHVADPFWCYFVNSISIVFAITSNIFLLLNYRKKIRYTYCQVFSISGWGIASLILTSLIIVYHWWFYHFNYHENYILGEGFWFAIITVILHFSNFLMLSINEIGFLTGKYKPLFNIDHIQETLIIQTTSMCVWLMIGASVFSRILEMNLSEAFYYSVVSVVTVGTQNLVPMNSPLAQTLTSIWIVCGLVMFGLIISSIRQMMLNFSSSTLYWNRSENLRRRLLKIHRNNINNQTQNKESFQLMQDIHKWAYTIEGVLELIFSIVVFMITLMCGAIAFALFENWPYKSSVYFCFYNLMTLGQGNQTPLTPGGRTFFCMWALASIPVMTISVSTASDFVFSKITKIEQMTFSRAMVEFCLSQKYLRKIGIFFKEREVNNVDKKMVNLMRTQSLILPKTSMDSKFEGTSDGTYTKDSQDNLENMSHSNFTISSTKDPIKKIPLVCHPADLLYTILLNSEGVSNYNFVLSSDFIKTNTATIQLANYFREGTYVDLDADRLIESRRQLGEKFKEIDDEFNIDTFNIAYSTNDIKKSRILSVINDGNIIQTSFKKKNDFVLNRLSRIQVILLKLRNVIFDLCSNPDLKYPYDEWKTLFLITKNEKGMKDPLYWIESGSPLTFPMNQPKYFLLHYVRHFELFLQQFAAEWDEYDCI